MSKGLKALEYLKDKGMIHNNAISRGCIEDIEKELKALEIIRKRECLFKGLSETTQDEYNLLKEVLL